MDATETATELQRIRDRIHDLAEVVHQHGAKIEVGRIEREHLKEAMDSMATREQVEQIRRDVTGIKDDIKKVNWVVILAVLAAILSTVLTR